MHWQLFVSLLIYLLVCCACNLVNEKQAEHPGVSPGFTSQQPPVSVSVDVSTTLVPDSALELIDDATVAAFSALHIAEQESVPVSGEAHTAKGRNYAWGSLRNQLFDSISASPRTPMVHPPPLTSSFKFAVASPSNSGSPLKPGFSEFPQEPSFIFDESEINVRIRMESRLRKMQSRAVKGFDRTESDEVVCFRPLLAGALSDSILDAVERAYKSSSRSSERTRVFWSSFPCHLLDTQILVQPTKQVDSLASSMVALLCLNENNDPFGIPHLKKPPVPPSIRRAISGSGKSQAGAAQDDIEGPSSRNSASAIRSRIHRPFTIASLLHWFIFTQMNELSEEECRDQPAGWQACKLEAMEVAKVAVSNSAKVDLPPKIRAPAALPRTDNIIAQPHLRSDAKKDVTAPDVD
jgi:hypothetical protein